MGIVGESRIKCTGASSAYLGSRRDLLGRRAGGGRAEAEGTRNAQCLFHFISFTGPEPAGPRRPTPCLPNEYNTRRLRVRLALGHPVAASGADLPRGACLP